MEYPRLFRSVLTDSVCVSASLREIPDSLCRLPAWTLLVELCRLAPADAAGWTPEAYSAMKQCPLQPGRPGLGPCQGKPHSPSQTILSINQSINLLYVPNWGQGTHRHILYVQKQYLRKR